MRRRREGHIPWVLLSVVLMLGACDTEITAVTGTDMPFTAYGLLSPDLDTQKVLVYPIEGTLRQRGSEPLDVTVRSIDLTTGEERFWNDSLVVGPDGLFEHVFQSTFRADYGHTYRLSIERPDGPVSHAEATVPPRTQVVSGTPRTFPGSVLWPVLVEGGAPLLHKIVVTYLVSARPVNSEVDAYDVSISYDGKEELLGGRWEIPIDLVGDYRKVEAGIVGEVGTALNRTFGIRINRVRIELIVASEDWNPPNGDFDPEVIVQPGTMSNFANGYGLVAAGYRHDVLLDPPDADALRAAGFTPNEESSD